MTRSRGKPTVHVRRCPLADGSVRETWSVRWRGGRRQQRRRTFASEGEAEFERGRLVLALEREGERVVVPSAPERRVNGRGASLVAPLIEVPEPEAEVPTLSAFWEQWSADARMRLATSTYLAYERMWQVRVEPMFGHRRLDEVRPKEIVRWRTALLDAGVGVEAVRKTMLTLQGISVSKRGSRRSGGARHGSRATLEQERAAPSPHRSAVRACGRAGGGATFTEDPPSEATKKALRVYRSPWLGGYASDAEAIDSSSRAQDVRDLVNR